MSSFPERLGRKITKHRAKLGISLRELSRRADVSPSVLSLGPVPIRSRPA
jgi:hypothetical protein